MSGLVLVKLKFFIQNHSNITLKVHIPKEMN